MTPAIQPGPSARPPSEVRFIDVHIEPWPEGQKVRVHVELTPFTEPPSLDISIVDGEGHEISSTSVIETAARKVVFTMHLRDHAPHQRYTLKARIVYPSIIEPVEQTEVAFELPDPSS